ncbi:hypothetical protein QTP88_017637 [Uroleucon formosanum]
MYGEKTIVTEVIIRYGIFQIITLPVSTATPERMFSNLKRVKSYLRNTMKEDRLNGLIMLSVYRNINLTPEEVIDKLGQKPRKIDIVV